MRLSELRNLTLKHRPRKRKSWFLFGLGGLFGVVVAAFFARQHDVINFDGLLDLNLGSVIDVIPAGIIKDAKDLTVWCYNELS